MIHKNNVKIVSSRSGHVIPEINGISLHSKFDPENESEQIVLKFKKKLSCNQFVIILGLGFGYHLHSISKAMHHLHGDNFKVIVIEPNSSTYHLYLKYCQENLHENNIEILHGFRVKDLFQNINFLNILSRPPTIILHPQSYNMYQTYFNELLSWRSSNMIDSICPTIKNGELVNFLKREQKRHKHLSSLLEEYKEYKQFKSKHELILLAFNDIVSREEAQHNYNKFGRDE